jgi:ankyrin repeat protein
MNEKAHWNRLLASGETQALRAALKQAKPPAIARWLDTERDWRGTPLIEAAGNPRCDTAMLALLVEAGADPDRITNGDYQRNALGAALGTGELAKVQWLVGAGARLHYSRGGYTAIIDAVHGRDVLRDPHLLDLLAWLIAQGVDLDAITRYGESALRVLSRLGRFDAVRLLLDAGADASQLEFSPLHHATVFGTAGEMAALMRAGADLEALDRWSRTPLLLAAQCGNLDKLDQLRAAGANFQAVGRCGKPLLFYPIDMHRADVLRGLLERGAFVAQTDEFGATALHEAAEQDAVDCIAPLLAAGAELDGVHNGETPLAASRSAACARRLLQAGADPAFLRGEVQRVLLGLPPEPDDTLLDCSAADFAAAARGGVGRRNGEEITHPYHLAMIRSGVSAYAARQAFGAEAEPLESPLWCAMRFGQSLTLLADGRVVQIAGEHEDGYDPDFRIYNDVFVHHPDGRIQVFGYPEDVFPPTDFHTATLVGGAIWIIGRLGYLGTRRPETTPVVRLDLATMRIEAVRTSGTPPAWLHRHRADLRPGGDVIRVTGGTVIRPHSDELGYAPNPSAFELNLRTGVWAECPAPPHPSPTGSQ